MGGRRTQRKSAQPKQLQKKNNEENGERIDKFVATAPKIVAQSSLHFIRLLRGPAATGVRVRGHA